MTKSGGSWPSLTFTSRKSRPASQSSKRSWPTRKPREKKPPGDPETPLNGFDPIGWERGLTVLKDRVRELRPVYLPPDPASRTSYVAGEIAQFDFWFPPMRLPVGFGQA